MSPLCDFEVYMCNYKVNQSIPVFVYKKVTKEIT